uniref:C2H2-type domain-containing protein n=2 Tax=Solanum tuberosum TaxID=4113 RepID=M1DXP4_SOLTU
MSLSDHGPRMSTHLELIECPICRGTVRGYQELMIHVNSHSDDEMEVDVVEGSNNLSEPLPRSSESVQHESLLLPTSMAPPPSFSYNAHFIRGNDDDRGVHTNQQLLSLSSYGTSSIRVSNEGGDVNTNQQLLSPSPSSSYRLLSVNNNNIRVEENQLQQMIQSTRRTYVRGLNSVVIDLNETPLEFERPHQKEVDFPILDKSDPLQLEFKPRLICDNETSEVDLSLKL